MLGVRKEHAYMFSSLELGQMAEKHTKAGIPDQGDDSR